MNVSLETWKRTWSLLPRVTGSERLLHAAPVVGNSLCCMQRLCCGAGEVQGQSYLVPFLQGAQLHLFNGLLGPGPQPPL